MTEPDMETILRNETIGLLIFHIASTGPTPGPDELPTVYQDLINDLVDMALFRIPIENN